MTERTRKESAKDERCSPEAPSGGLDDEAALRRQFFHDLRAREYQRLDAGGHAYLDYTGSGLHAESQLRRHMELLGSTVLGNPHSENPASTSSTGLVERARQRILAFLDADPDEYLVTFTSNASGALKLVGEAYPFGPGARFVLAEDNHNSVNGIREYARGAGARVTYAPLDDELRMDDPAEFLPDLDGDAPGLFAYPAQSNFSGVKHPLAWVDDARERGYDVLMDTAAYLPTNPLSLSRVKPDFLCVSFYKMFGYPTGVGALVARRDTVERLKRPWFAGGTVEFVSTQRHLHRLFEGAEQFEDGTPNFQAIPALEFGLDVLEEVGMERLRLRIRDLTDRLLQGLTGLKHSGGEPLVRVYGPTDTEARGGVVPFNLLDRNGDVLHFDRVEQRAADAKVSIRGGCFCNPGASERAFGFPPSRAEDCLEPMMTGPFSPEEYAGCMGGSAAGALRASLGIASTEEDVDRLVEVLGSFADVEYRERESAR